MSNDIHKLTLSLLGLGLQSLPSQTETFVNALTAFTVDQSDPTGLKVYNLIEMAKNLRTTYEHIESLLQSFDTSAPEGRHE